MTILDQGSCEVGRQTDLTSDTLEMTDHFNAGTWIQSFKPEYSTEGTESMGT
jgi:hypothetical protein